MEGSCERGQGPFHWTVETYMMMMVGKWCNGICGRENGRNSKKNYPDSDLFTIKSTWSDRDANSGPQQWELSEYRNLLCHRANLIIITSSTCVQHSAGSRNVMWWSPYIEGQWVARVSADYACHTITGANEMDEMSVEKWWNEICNRERQEKPWETPTQTPFRPSRNPHGVTETRTWDPSSGRRVPNRLCYEAAYLIIN